VVYVHSLLIVLAKHVILVVLDLVAGFFDG
jgi:hypothetical protein